MSDEVVVALCRFGPRQHVRPIGPCPECGGKGGWWSGLQGYVTCSVCNGAARREKPRPHHDPIYGLVDYAEAIADDLDLSPEQYKALVDDLKGAVEDVTDRWDRDRTAEVVAAPKPSSTTGDDRG